MKQVSHRGRAEEEWGCVKEEQKNEQGREGRIRDQMDETRGGR